MANTDEKKQGGSDQGNAIENETREAGGASVESEIEIEIEEVDDDSQPVKPWGGEPVVTEEDSKLAEEHGYGGESRGKRY